MKKIVEKEVHFCDSCGKETYVSQCLVCVAEYCWECEKKEMVEYKSGVWSSGLDGHYCLRCNSELLVNKNNPIHELYVRIKYLRMENESWYKEFKKRADATEKELREWLDERNAFV